MKDLKDKVVWITGASSGIGEATALELARQGAKLVLSARRTDELERVKKATGLSEENIMVLPMDVENFKELEGLCQQVLNKYGRIDVLYNNAGISQRGNAIESTMEVYRKLMEINYFGVIALTKLVLPIMIKQNFGHFVVTSSVSGKLGSPWRSGYCASKHAIHGFFDALRSEVYENNIKVTIVCPGYINTDISVNSLATDGSKYGKKDTNQLKGMSVETCAKKIVFGIKKEKSEIYMGGKEILAVYLKRFFPTLLNKILVNQVPK